MILLLWLLVLLTFVPVSDSDRGLVRIWEFPRLQVAVLLVVISALLLWVGQARSWAVWVTLAAAVLALAWQAKHFIPYTPIVATQLAGVGECPPGRDLSLLTANVFQENRNYDALLNLVKRTEPDVLLLLETDRGWARAVSSLNARYPYRIAKPLPNTYGMMLFSKIPMSGHVRYRLQPGVPSIDSRLRLPGGNSVDLHAVHPEPPMPGEDTGERDAELVIVGRDVRGSGRAAIVLGDLNDVGWSDTSQLFRRLSGMLDPRVGRGLYPTFHADYFFARWPLDHLFVTEHFRLLGIERLGDIGSDHFPLLYRVCLAQDAGRRLTPAEVPAELSQEAVEEVRQQRTEDSDE